MIIETHIAQVRAQKKLIDAFEININTSQYYFSNRELGKITLDGVIFIDKGLAIEEWGSSVRDIYYN